MQMSNGEVLPGISKPLDWAYAPSGLMCWSDGYLGRRYQVNENFTGDAIHLTGILYGDGGPEDVIDVIEQTHGSFDEAKQAAQRHQDAQVLEWLHPDLVKMLQASPAPLTSRMNEDSARQLTGVTMPERSADHTWSVLEMVDRQQRALRALLEVGEAFLVCHVAPDRIASSRPAYEQAWMHYDKQRQMHLQTHDRAEALEVVLAQMTPAPMSPAEPAGGRFDDLEAEYRFTRAMYLDQRSHIRDELNLADDSPEVLRFIALTGESSALDGHVVLGHSREGYHVGVIPEGQSHGIEWSAGHTGLESAIETAEQALRDGALPEPEYLNFGHM